MRQLLLAAVLAVAVAICGCASNAASSVSVGGPTPLLPPGGTRIIVDGGLVAGTSIAISAAAANAIAVVGIVTLVAVGNDWKAFPPPGMRADRSVNVQDCSKPIVNWTANLRCATPEELAQMAREAAD